MRTDTAHMNSVLEPALQRLRAKFGDSEDMAIVESYCATAQRVFAKTNPSKLREAATTVWIQALMPKENA